MKTTFSDCIHGSVRIEDEDKEFFRICQKDLARLQKVRQLGVISEFHLGANHSKLEQTLGLYHLICRLLSTPHVHGIRPEALRRAALIRAIGHCPMTFSTERGILRASFVDASPRKKLTRMFIRVENRMGKDKCRKCGHICRKRAIESCDVFELYKWFSGYKLVTRILPSIEDMEDGISSLARETLEYLVCVKSMGHDIIARMNELDYVRRDMHYSGLLSVSIDTDALLTEVKTSTSRGLFYPRSYREILSSAKRFLREKVYEEPGAVALVAILDNLVAREILSGQLNLRGLIDIDDITLFSMFSEDTREEFESLKERCLTSKMKEVTRVTFPGIQGGKFQNRNALEKELFNTTKKSLVEMCLGKNIFINYLPETSESPSSLAIIHDSESKEISPMFDVLSRIESIGGATRIDLIDLVRYLFGKESIDLEASQVEKALREMLKTNKDMLTDFKTKKGGEAGRGGFGIYLKKDDQFISLEDPASYMVYEIQKMKNVDILLRFLIDRLGQIHPSFLEKLGKAVLKYEYSSELEGAKYETLAFLRELHDLDTKTITRWVLPGVVFWKDDGTREGEIDVMSLSLNKEGDVQVKLIECSTSDSDKKYHKDVRKSIRKKEQMLSRFHEDPNFNIECEIVGPSAPVKHTKTDDLASYYE